VDLIRPPVEYALPDGSTRVDIARFAREKRPEEPVYQDTISLDTKDKRYVTYARLVKEIIMKHWTYPTRAKEHLLEGKLTVVFSLAGNGDMVQVAVNRKSRHKILDQEAVRAITAAAPFPPFPKHITAKRLNIIANFDYRLKAGR
jgi:protein TonB